MFDVRCFLFVVHGPNARARCTLHVPAFHEPRTLATFIAAFVASFVVEMKNGKLTPVLIFTGLTSGASTEVLSGLGDAPEASDQNGP